MGLKRCKGPFSPFFFPRRVLPHPHPFGQGRATPDFREGPGRDCTAPGGAEGGVRFPASDRPVSGGGVSFWTLVERRSSKIGHDAAR